VKHVSQKALTAGAIELKGEDEDPVSIITKSLDDLTKTVGGRLDALEKKGDAKLDEKTLARLVALENQAARPNGGTATDAEQKAQAEVERKAFGTYLRRGNQGVAEDELKALTVSSDPSGGYLAPPEMNAEFIRNLVLVSPIRSIASVRSTTAPSVKYPKRTSITNAQWENETDDEAESTVAFGQAEIPIRMMTTYVDISNQLLSDSAGQAEAEVNLALSQDFGQKEGLAFVKGDGVIAPEGFMTNADVGYTANGGTGGIDPDALIALMYSLPAPYRTQGEWVMNGTTLGVIRQIKDTQGRYIWQPGLTLGQPETILGRPVMEAVDMDDPTANAFPIAFGDFSTAYRIVDRVALSILVNPYVMATKGITRIHATRRVGAGIIVPGAITKLKYAAS
jgi:HK97 family phage major capsid protein